MRSYRQTIFLVHPRLRLTLCSLATRVKRHTNILLKVVVLVLVLLAITLLPSKAFAATDPDGVSQWIVVTAPMFRPALKPLIEHRRAEGFKVTVLETTDFPKTGLP